MNYLSQMSLRDIERSFCGSFIFFRNKEKMLIPSYVDGMEATINLRVTQMEDGGLVTREISPTHKDIVLLVPDMGYWYDAEEGKHLYVWRTAERQYIRGVRPASLRYLCAGDIFNDGVVSSWRLIKVHKLLYDIANGIRAEGVLDRDFCLTKSKLFFRGIPVGREVDNNTIEVFYKNVPKIDGINFCYAGGSNEKGL